MEKINAIITGIGGYVPDYILTNEELSRMVDTSDEWIMTRVGIKERRILTEEGLGTSYLARKAAKQLIAKTGVDPDTIDALIVTTTTPDYKFPSTASIVVGKLGLKNAFAFDFEAACCGFLYSLDVAASMIQSGRYKKIIVIGADKMSSLIDYTDRQTCVLFGDGAGAVLVVDGAQSTPHIPVDVQALDADFFAFSGHKVYGPMGIGVLYGREELLNAMPPFLTGGEMIESVTRDGAVFAELPHKFEAGTVNAADAVGLHAAIDYVKSIGFTAMHQQEVALTRRAMDAIGEMPHVHVLGSEKPEEHCGIITFTVDGVHPHDISEILVSDGVAIRAGHHCAQPLLAYLKHPSTARASLAFYNTESEVDRLLDSISTLRERMGYGK